MDVRAANVNDLTAISELTQANRRRLEELSPRYFRQRVGSDTAHANFLEFLLGVDDHDAQVFTVDRSIVGFYHVMRHPVTPLVEDLCFLGDDHWSEAAEILRQIEVPWATHVARGDDRRAELMAEIGLQVVSTFFSRFLDEFHEPAQAAPPGHASFDTTRVGRHAFGPGPMSAETAGALVIDGPLGRVTGSPSMDPPIYDPGGTTCVVDHVEGPKRQKLLAAALDLAVKRGDVHMIMICDQSDSDFRQILKASNFRAAVDFYVNE